MIGGGPAPCPAFCGAAMLVTSRLPCRAVAVHRATSGVYWSPRPDGLRGPGVSPPPRWWWSVWAWAFAAAGAAVAAAPASCRRSPSCRRACRCPAAPRRPWFGLLRAIYLSPRERSSRGRREGRRERGSGRSCCRGRGPISVPAARHPAPCGAVWPRLCGVGCLSGSVSPGPIAPRPGLLGRLAESLVPRPRRICILHKRGPLRGSAGATGGQGRPPPLRRMGPPITPLCAA